MDHYVSRLCEARLQQGKHSLLLLGARQVGKSTLLKALNPSRQITLANEEVFLQYAKDPGLLGRELTAIVSDSLQTVLIDEVQRLPALLNTVQMLLDEYPKRFRFLLSGSSARKLRRGGANLLPGRVLREELGPLTCLELDQSFDLPRALQVGCLPGIYLDGESGQALLSSYVDTYLREEIRQEALVRDVGAYARFLDLAAVVSGQFLNYAKLASDAEISKQTLIRFVDVLEDTLIGHRILPWSPKSRSGRRLLQREKLVLFDVGVRNALLKKHDRPVAQDDVGSVFEQLVLQQLISIKAGLKKNWKISSYRSQGGSEVDAVIEVDDQVIGVEIKAGKTISRSDLRGLQSLKELCTRGQRFHPYVVYTGTTAQQFPDGTRALPFIEAMKEISAF